MQSTIELANCDIVLSLDLKRGQIMGADIDADIPPWLWLELARNHPELMHGQDIEIEFTLEGDIEIDRSGPGPAYTEASGLSHAEGSGRITGETQDIKIDGHWELATEIIGVWGYELGNTLIDSRSSQS